jgi:hypothetical protein
MKNISKKAEIQQSIKTAVTSSALLKSLGMYLPYQIKAYFKEVNDRYCRRYVTGTIHSVYDDASITCYDTVNSSPDKFKLILRPIDDFYDINCPEICKTGFDITTQLELVDLCLRKQHYSGLRYSDMKEFLRYHIDIFGLIDKGVAISIHDV